MDNSTQPALPTHTGFIDLTGHSFGRLLVVKFLGRNSAGRFLWDCVCDCGRCKAVRGEALRNRWTHSCGCLRSEQIAKRNFRHGLRRIPEYRVWLSMKDRCHNPDCHDYKDYGGRGITVSDAWRASFEKFIEDMGRRPSPKHTLERKGNNEPYSAENCCWATWSAQRSNRRTAARGREIRQPKQARRLHPAFRDLAGKRYGLWSVISRAESRGHGCYWSCVCDCGTNRTVSADSLVAGKSRSCGCAGAAKAAAKAATKGPTSAKEYGVWQQMRNRCNDPENLAYAYYGERGIAVCSRWEKSYACFIGDMGLRPGPSYSLDRIDNNGNYEPGNCRWATKGQQCRNRSSTILVAFQGRTQCLTDWANEFGIPFKVLHNRFRKLGWTFERTLTTPIRELPRRRCH